MFKDKVVIVTGASSGIGKALAVAFANEGSKVVLAARNVENLKSVESICNQKGAETLVISTDVAVESECKNLIEKTVQTFGRIDILVNNAGISMRALFNDVDLKVIKNLMDVNFYGTVYCSKYALPYLLHSSGSLAGVISIAGIRGLPARTGYSASKYAVFGFLETIRTENIKTGLHVLIVAPGWTNTNIRNTALTKDGSIQKESPRNENNMMTPETVAAKTLKAIKRRKRLLILTTLGKSIYWTRQVIPFKIADRIIFNILSKEPDSPLK
jgi:short-subunit dehydrogenase